MCCRGKSEKVARKIGEKREGNLVGTAGFEPATTTPPVGLKSKCVIHTVCPRYIHGTDQEKTLLAEAYRASHDLHKTVTDVDSVAFMSMGTGVSHEAVDVCKCVKIEASRVPQRCLINHERISEWQTTNHTLAKTS